ncbi:MAG: fumarate hydratase C-terminal domain-containing protein, partial [Clostridia bacterium]|nr:fumarate hydratase C-terminal domain-containing protein [Clostridia bacterium]
MKEIAVHTDQLKELAPTLRAGDRVLLSGTVYTARDAAHKRMFAQMAAGEPLPFEWDGAAVYYAGPTPAPDGLPIGA